MATREVIEGPELPRHKSPIPTAVRMGPFVFSSDIAGQDPATRTAPPDPELQVKLAFENVRRVMAAAGGTTDNIARLAIYVRELQNGYPVGELNDLINREWLQMFPDEHNRPVRRILRGDLPGVLVVQLEFIAVL